jgi:hypothetical protein
MNLSRLHRLTGHPPVSRDARQKGRVLKVKLGFNPNSSSVGTVLLVFPMALFTASIIFAGITSLLLAKKSGDAKRPQKQEKDNG